MVINSFLGGVVRTKNSPDDLEDSWWATGDEAFVCRWSYCGGGALAVGALEILESGLPSVWQ